MLSLKLDEYRGIIVVSGDGLVYEVINGLMNRPDWREAIKTPVGQIPGGSANALACCTAHLTNEAFKNMSLGRFAASMAFYYSKSKPAPLDLVTIQLSNKRLIHSFLNVEWAIVADVDLESEKYRFLGNSRFLVGALKRILSLRVYRGRISFLPADEMKDYKPKNANIKVLKPNANNNNNNETLTLRRQTIEHRLSSSNSEANQSSVNIHFLFLFYVYTCNTLNSGNLVHGPNSGEVDIWTMDQRTDFHGKNLVLGPWA